MLREHRERIAARLERALRDVIDDPGFNPVPLVLERPRQPEHGDLATSVCLQLAKPLRCKPRDLAERLVARLRDTTDPDDPIASAEVAGPGFVNLRVSAAVRASVVDRVLAAGERFGRSDRGGGRPVAVEFVSANPTGPLHVGHGRQAALGDAIAALLALDGWRVHREFYYNDAGAQIQNLALSVQARARGFAPDDPRFPADGYRGEYIAEIAAAFLERRTVGAANVEPVTGGGDADDLDAVRRFAVAWLRHEQDIDLKHFGVAFDRYYLESSLYEDGRVARTVEALQASGHTFEADGALWLRTTDFGDDKDRVMRKSDGSFTYFVPDVAYHVTKWERGFARAINVQGSDHHGTTARVRAGLQALGLGIPQGYPDYVLHKMVTVMRGGEEVKISKRAGSYVTLRDLIEWSAGDGGITRGRDAVRFFLVSRKADTQFVFDVDLALARTDENPVYYIQYAHARICSVLAQDPQTDALIQQRSRPADLALLTTEREQSLFARLAQWPDVVESASDELAPHAVAFYLKDLAAELHAYYNSERFLVEDGALRFARLTLLSAVRQVLRNGLCTLGVSAPDRM